MKAQSKTVICKICGFNFDAPITMRESEGCYTEAYCAQMDFMKYARMVGEHDKQKGIVHDDIL